MRTVGIILFIVFFIPIAQLGFGDERADYIRSHYAKYEYRIPMRDGVKLFTAVYAPYDDSKTYPILMQRTPYRVAPYGLDQYKGALGPHEAYEKEGFIFVFQDVRGRFMSEGEFLHMTPHIENKTSDKDVDESSDTYDTIEWLLKHVPNHNGNVGQVGISYPGFYTSAGAIDSHSALKAISPQAPVADFCWDDVYHNGAFLLSHIFPFFARFQEDRDGLMDEWNDPIYDVEAKDSYTFFMDVGPLKNVNQSYFKKKSRFWNDITNHPNYDTYWQKRNILPHLKNIKPAVMVVGGWFDREDLYGPLKTYETIEKQNPGILNMLVMGPWRHGGWRGTGDQLGDADFGFPTADYYKENVELDFFKHHLKGGEGELDLPEALVFETGANRWREFDAWPPQAIEKHSFYFHEDSELSFDAPNQSKGDSDSFVSDPQKPVPHTTLHDRFINNTFYTEDQRYASRRQDVLVYQTEVLEDDVTIAGPIDVDLFVSTTGTDADWIVKLIDVNPNDNSEKGGQHSLIRAEVFRSRFRDSFEHPKALKPGEISEIQYQLWDVFHTFKRGHRIMVHVQSTWFPFIDRNPQKYVRNIFEADEDDFIKATHTVYRSKEHPSHIGVNILPNP